MNEISPDRAPRRRWFRFSLRTLLLLVTVLGVWLGLHLQAVRRQKESIAAIKNVGGWCYYDFQNRSGQPFEKGRITTSFVPSWLRNWLDDDFFYNVTVVDMTSHYDAQGQPQKNDLGTGDDLKYLAGFPKLGGLSVQNKQASNVGLAHVGKSSNLESLAIGEAQDVDDEGVAHLSRLRNLKYIFINQSQITDESLKVFAAMPSLKALYLQGNHFTDRGLAYLSQATHIRHLWIGGGYDRGITDDGLIHLKGLVNLEELDLRDTKVTAAGLEHLKGLKNLKHLETDVVDVSDLQAALPNCQITHPITIKPSTADE